MGAVKEKKFVGRKQVINRISIDIRACSCTVESDTESLDKVHSIADEIIVKITAGITGGASTEERLKKVGIQ